MTRHGPGGVPGLEGRPQGVTVAIDTRLDLRPFRLDRDPRRSTERPCACTLPELGAALAHPDVTVDEHLSIIAPRPDRLRTRNRVGSARRNEHGRRWRR